MESTHKFRTKIHLSRLFHVCWFVLFSGLLATTLKYDPYTIAAPLLAAVCIAFIGFVFIRYADTINAWNTAKANRCAIVLLLLLLMLLLFAGRILLAYPINDAGTIYYSTVETVLNGEISKDINQYTSCVNFYNCSNNDYFCIYKASFFLVAYLFPFMKLIIHGMQIDPYSLAGCYAMIVFNCLSITAAAALGYAALRKAQAKNAGALLFLVLFLFFAPNYLNTYKVYSDTLSMPYISLALFCLFTADRSTGSKRWLFYLLTGISVAIGSLIKGSVMVLIVAIVLYLLLCNRQTLRLRILSSLCIILSFGTIIAGWNLYLPSTPWVDWTNQDRYELPSTHWLMMASVGDGGFRQESVDYSFSFETLQERKEGIATEYIRRVKSHGSVLGYSKFIIKKLAQGLADGRFCQQVHLNAFYEHYPLREVVTQWGKYFPAMILYLKFYAFLLYLGMLLCTALNALKSKVDESFLINVCFFGVMLFFAFWEFKSRYLMNFTPLMMMGLVLAMKDLELHFATRKL